MNEYIFLMFGDAADAGMADDGALWDAYISRLQASGQFDGGSAIGAGLRCRKGSDTQPAPPGCTGFIRLRAESLAAAQALLAGNPVYEAGGTVEVRELPHT
ncbi:hypothetical protein [Pseudoduganella sp.]|uniref:hypothetical protein n=1 Tax=Pseudoduganella sp. TaxID=1880898 RepID=UPI0035AF96BB